MSGVAETLSLCSLFPISGTKKIPVLVEGFLLIHARGAIVSIAAGCNM